MPTGAAILAVRPSRLVIGTDEGFSAKVLKATYEVAYVQHTPMEPRAATVQWQDGKLTAWAGVDYPQRIQGDLAGVRLDGALQVDNVKRRYELAALASRLGGDPSAMQFLRDALVDAGINANGLARLDERVDQLLESMHSIQRAVYGEIRYGGQSDA